MIIALKTGDADGVMHYLKTGISPHTADLIDGALNSGNVEIVRSFLDHGLDLSLPINTCGETPLFRSLEKKDVKILELLIMSGADIHGISMGVTALHKAAAIWSEGAALLLEAGSNIHARATDGRTPLMSAAHGNQIPSLEVLIEAGANFEDRDNEGTTALILASRAGMIESATWLLDHGADIDAKDKRGKTAEDWARKNGQQKVAELLQARKIK